MQPSLFCITSLIYKPISVDAATRKALPKPLDSTYSITFVQIWCYHRCFLAPSTIESKLTFSFSAIPQVPRFIFTSFARRLPPCWHRILCYCLRWKRKAFHKIHNLSLGLQNTVRKKFTRFVHITRKINLTFSHFLRTTFSNKIIISSKHPFKVKVFSSSYIFELVDFDVNREKTFLINKTF